MNINNSNSGFRLSSPLGTYSESVFTKTAIEAFVESTNAIDAIRKNFLSAPLQVVELVNKNAISVFRERFLAHNVVNVADEVKASLGGASEALGLTGNDSSTSQNRISEKAGKLKLKQKLRNSGKRHLLKALELIGWEEIKSYVITEREDLAITTLESLHKKIKGLSQGHKKLLQKIPELPDTSNGFKSWSPKDLSSVDSNTPKSPSSSVLSRQVNWLEKKGLVECSRGIRKGKKTYIRFVRLTALGCKVVEWFARLAEKSKHSAALAEKSKH